GMLADGEGRVIDFKNTVIVMTSNLATDLITAAAQPGGDIPPLEDITALVKPVISAHFKPALLARMTVVPYIPIGPEALQGIAKMKIGAIAKRAKQSQGVDLQIDDNVITAIADRCKEVESGARNVDHILRGTVMPLISDIILEGMAKGEPVDKLRLSLDKSGDIVCLPGTGGA
ncbi:MAG: AAA family ATPase, partial [Polyangiales bacterium]